MQNSPKYLWILRFKNKRDIVIDATLSMPVEIAEIYY